MLGLPKRSRSNEGGNDERKRDDQVATSPFPDKFKVLPENKNWADSLDKKWRVKDQGSCGSCWTFSAIGALSGNCGIVNNTWVDLAEQELVDCCTTENHYFECTGCNGGWMSGGLIYAYDKDGVAATDDYSYTARNGSCKTSASTTRYCGPQNVLHFPAGSYDDLIHALNTGPVAVGVNAGAWHSYVRGGIIDHKICSSKMSDVNHGVVAVGWGYDKDLDAHYWLLKNSWGARWGDDGYIRIERNINGKTEDNACAILELNSFPMMKN